MDGFVSQEGHYYSTRPRRRMTELLCCCREHEGVSVISRHRPLLPELHVRKGTLEGSSWTSGAGTGTLWLRGARPNPSLIKYQKGLLASFVCWYCELAALLTANAIYQAQYFFLGVFTLSTRYLLFNRLWALGDAGAKKNKENVKNVLLLLYIIPGAYEGRSVQLHLNLNGCDTSLIWTYSQVGNIRCGHGVSVAFIATHYSAHYSARYAALSTFA